MFKQRQAFYYLIVVALLIFSIFVGLVVNGIKTFYEYDRVLSFNMPANYQTIKHFVKSELRKELALLRVEPFPEESNIQTIKLYVDEKDIELLNENLPVSGRTKYYPGYMVTDIAREPQKVKYRYRGDTLYNWISNKKSVRIQMEPFEAFNGEQALNIVNPPTPAVITDWVSYEIAREAGILAPDYYPVRLFINNRYNGIHFYLSQIDESFLRKNKRMPGSIYSGDRVFNPGKSASEAFEVYTQIKNGQVTPMLWFDYRLWNKKASRNFEEQENYSDIKEFIKIINSDDKVEFFNKFNLLFNKEKYYLLFGLDTLFGTQHRDLFHNHKVYVDPYYGRYEPIIWDVRFWTNKYLYKDLSFYPLVEQVKLNPILEYERDVVGYGLLKRFNKDYVYGLINKDEKVILREWRSDPYPYVPFFLDITKTHTLDVFSADALEFTIKQLKYVYGKRHDFLENKYEESDVHYKIYKSENECCFMRLSISGNSPVKVDPYLLLDKYENENIIIDRQHEKGLVRVNRGDIDILYPGRRKEEGNALGVNIVNNVNMYGDYKLVPSPLHYVYRITGLNSLEINDLRINEGGAFNAITGSDVKLHYADTLPGDEDTLSIHPWTIGMKKRVCHDYSGYIDVDEDLIIEEGCKVSVSPGTTFAISPGKSIFIYGRLAAIGTSENPIRFIRKEPNRPWGSIVLQGSGVNGSRMEFLDVSGGSIASRNLVKYSGQINIHGVRDFVLKNCEIEKNEIGDDSLHIAYSKGKVSGCIFKDSFQDAIDVDISEVDLKDNVIINSGNDAIDLMTSVANMEKITVKTAGDKCFSIGEESNVSIVGSSLLKCDIGIAVKDGSKAKVANIEFKMIGGAAISLYQKNDRYDRGGEIWGERLLGLDKDDVAINGKSLSHIADDELLSLDAR